MLTTKKGRQTYSIFDPSKEERRGLTGRRGGKEIGDIIKGCGISVHCCSRKGKEGGGI